MDKLFLKDIEKWIDEFGTKNQLLHLKEICKTHAYTGHFKLILPTQDHIDRIKNMEKNTLVLTKPFMVPARFLGL